MKEEIEGEKSSGTNPPFSKNVLNQYFEIIFTLIG